MLRFTQKDVEGTWPKDQDMVLQNSSVEKSNTGGPRKSNMDDK
jgi:hypothetical protein